MINYSIQDIKLLIAKTLTDKEIPNEFLMNKWQEQSQYSNNSMHLYYHLFFRIAEQLQPNFTIELGGWRGLAAGCFAGGNELGTVVTIDHHGDPGDEAHRIEMIKMESHFPNMHYLQGWTWDVLPQVKEFGKQIDMIFIDGWHQYEYAKKDWDMYSPLLANGALVICDDLLKGDYATIAGMMKFWDEISNGFEKHIEDSKIHLGYPMGFFKYEYK